MQPMPVMKPEITGSGIRLMYRPMRRRPNRICNSPASMTTVKATAGSAANCVKMVAETTVMGPVGPEICDGVPPNSAANSPTQIAPCDPRDRSHPGGDPESEGQRQCDDRGGQSAEEITA